jgi:hypothetical protein
MADFSLKKEWRLSLIQSWRAVRESRAELERLQRRAATDVAATAAQTRQAIDSSIRLLRETNKKPRAGGDQRGANERPRGGVGRLAPVRG